MMAAALTLAGMSLGELLGAAAGGYAELEITDLVMDSREVSAGAAFVAVPGARAHGLAYADAAFAKGAAVVLYEPDAAVTAVREPSIAIPDLRARLGELAETFFGSNGGVESLAAVTGTNGKTTVAYLTSQAMTEAGTACGYLGTLGFGRPGTLTSHTLTTPDCLTLHRELRQLAVSHAALEVSSHAIAQRRIAGLEIGVAAFTNLTRDHLDQHGDMARYGETKARLFELPGLHTAVINIDDGFGRSLVARLPADVTALRVTLEEREAELCGQLSLRGLAGLDLAITGRFGQATLRSPLLGRFNAENLLVSLGQLLAWGVPLERAVDALGRAGPPPGRLEVLGGAPYEPIVVIDYAHTPDALARVLDMLRGLGPAELWCVFGCGGERDRGKRFEMGAVAERAADHVVLTDDNPRGEDPAAIVADIRAGFDDPTRVAVVHDRRAAIVQAVHAARPGDVVLVAGKGHEAYQLIAGARLAFDDRRVARDALGART